MAQESRLLFTEAFALLTEDNTWVPGEHPNSILTQDQVGSGSYELEVTQVPAKSALLFTCEFYLEGASRNQELAARITRRFNDLLRPGRFLLYPPSTVLHDFVWHVPPNLEAGLIAETIGTVAGTMFYSSRDLDGIWYSVTRGWCDVELGIRLALSEMEGSA